MDFGDILSQWEMSQRKDSGGRVEKRSGASSGSKKKPNADFIEQGFSCKKDADKERSRRNEIRRKEAESNSSAKTNPMEQWLSRYGVFDKDKSLEHSERQKRMQSREYVKSLPVDAAVDLHGMSRNEAWSRLDNFVRECVRRKFRKIMIIHGKGNHSASNDPVLGELVRLFVEKNPSLGASGHPGREQGGTCATWVLIKDDLP